MLAEHIKLTRRNPITGRSRRGVRDIQYAAVNDVVFRLTHFHSGFQPVRIELADEHLTAAGLHAWRHSWYSNLIGNMSTFDEAREWMAEGFRSQESAELLAHHEQAVETWQMLDVDPARLAAPFRVVELTSDHYLAVANDPRPLLWQQDNLAWEDGTPRLGGSSVLAEASRHSPSLDGADYTGWIISSEGGRCYSDIIERKSVAMACLRTTAAESLAEAGGPR
ncbi:hypothetical protein ACF09G_36325 [Streptomyces albogriseolus]|uniref:hypothetical protein n=1 Tax=Streptomyces albogriseolus TaxID=1887 RepID=UPI0019A79079|nr:hypothetical protein [Streptomyces sp.]